MHIFFALCSVITKNRTEIAASKPATAKKQIPTHLGRVDFLLYSRLCATSCNNVELFDVSLSLMVKPFVEF